MLNRLSAAVVSQTSTEQMAETCLARDRRPARRALGGALRASRTAACPPTGRRPSGAASDASVDELRGARLRRRPARPPSRAAGDGGLYVPVHSPSGVSGVLTVQARDDGRPYSAVDARLVTSLGNLVGAFLERERLQRPPRRRRRRGGRPAQVEPALVGLARAQDPAGGPDRHREQPARERRGLGRGERARRTARDRGRCRPPQHQHQRAPRALAARGARVGAATASSTGSSEIVAAGIDMLPAHLRERVSLDLPERYRRRRRLRAVRARHPDAARERPPVHRRRR